MCDGRVWIYVRFVLIVVVDRGRVLDRRLYFDGFVGRVIVELVEFDYGRFDFVFVVKVEYVEFVDGLGNGVGEINVLAEKFFRRFGDDDFRLFR